MSIESQGTMTLKELEVASCEVAAEEVQRVGTLLYGLHPEDGAFLDRLVVVAAIRVGNAPGLFVPA